MKALLFFLVEYPLKLNARHANASESERIGAFAQCQRHWRFHEFLDLNRKFIYFFFIDFTG